MTLRLDYSAHAPDGVKALGSLYAYLSKSDLPKALLDLVYLRTSQINGCAYCIDVHTADLLKEGEPVQKLALMPVWREAEAYYSERERAALAWTETVTRVSETHVPDADFEAARAVFGEKELADLTLAIGLMNTYNRLAISFRRDPPSLAPARP